MDSHTPQADVTSEAAGLEYATQSSQADIGHTPFQVGGLADYSEYIGDIDESALSVLDLDFQEDEVEEPATEPPKSEGFGGLYSDVDALRDRVAALEARIENHNSRSGHKI